MSAAGLLQNAMATGCARRRFAIYLLIWCIAVSQTSHRALASDPGGSQGTDGEATIDIVEPSDGERVPLSGGGIAVALSLQLPPEEMGVGAGGRGAGLLVCLGIDGQVLLCRDAGSVQVDQGGVGILRVLVPSKEGQRRVSAAVVRKSAIGIQGQDTAGAGMVEAVAATEVVLEVHEETGTRWGSARLWWSELRDGHLVMLGEGGVVSLGLVVSGVDAAAGAGPPLRLEVLRDGSVMSASPIAPEALAGGGLNVKVSGVLGGVGGLTARMVMQTLWGDGGELVVAATDEVRVEFVWGGEGGQLTAGDGGDRQRLLEMWGEAGMAKGPWPLPCSEALPNDGFPPIQDFGEERPFVVASWIKWFDALGFDPNDVSSCPTKCLFVHIASASPPPSCIDMADLLLITANGTPPRGAWKAPWQVWGYFSLESGAVYPEMDDEGYMAAFDLELTTRSKARVRLTFAPREAGVVRRGAGGGGRKVAALYLQGNCVAERDGFVSDLMSHGVRVESLGGCLKNGVYPSGVSTLEVISRYRYMLCLENSAYPDFVTERVFNAWIAGAIPIYRGAPNIASYAPSPSSYILADDFGDAGSLAAYLSYLDENSTARDEYLAFKRPGFPLSRGYLSASRESVYARGGEGGSADPFPRADAMRDLSDESLLSFTDARCLSYNASIGSVDDRGVSTLSRESACFAGHRLKASDHHRYNRLAACRICEEVAKVQRDAALTCPANPPSLRLSHEPERRLLGLHLQGFAAPRDGVVKVEVRQGGAVFFESVLEGEVPEGGSFLSLAGLPAGDYSVSALLITNARRMVARQSIAVSVAEGLG